MFKTIADKIWAFDLEWIPDPRAGRLVYDLPGEITDKEVIAEMWKHAGASEEEPRPYLKTILCRIVSVAAVTREKNHKGEYLLDLRYLPKNPDQALEEQQLIADFLQTLGKSKPQLVGFNSSEADLPILLQRGVAAGVTAPDFCQRPDKPWEGKDYFSQYADSHIDLKKILGGWGKATPSLHELAQVSGIPGKMDTTGDSVVDLWLEGKIRAIVEYNQFDALTTYLIWLRVAHFAGFFSAKEYECEQEKVKNLINVKIKAGETHLTRFLKRWLELKDQIKSNTVGMTSL
jgi:predicted PolB exonuclease-like 3'-5' exonuclease